MHCQGVRKDAVHGQPSSGTRKVYGVGATNPNPNPNQKHNLTLTLTLTLARTRTRTRTLTRKVYGVGATAVGCWTCTPGGFPAVLAA